MFLEELSEHLRRVGNRVVETPRFAAIRRELAAHEDRFRTIMRRYPTGITNPADRRRAAGILDAAYEKARHSWDPAPFWRAVYADRAATVTLNRGRRQGLIELTNQMIRNDNAPRIITFNERGRSLFESANIDHAVPLERQPFRGLDPQNLRATTRRYNQQWLNLWSRHGAFPMEIRRTTDDIEDFVLANRLSRRQRLRTPAIGGLAMVLGPVLDLIQGSARAGVYTDIADDIRARRQRREGTRPIGRDAVDPKNLDQYLDRVFGDRTPPEVDSSRRAELVAAFGRWLELSHSEERDPQLFERCFSDAKRIEDNSERNECLGLLMEECLNVRDDLEHGRSKVDALLGSRDLYLQRAQALEHVVPIQEDVLEEELQSYGIELDDAIAIADWRYQLPFAYRGYVSDLEQLRDLLLQALELNASRRGRIDQALGIR